MLPNLCFFILKADTVKDPTESGSLQEDFERIWKAAHLKERQMTHYRPADVLSNISRPSSERRLAHYKIADSLLRSTFWLGVHGKHSCFRLLPNSTIFGSFLSSKLG
jgi:hypothetical protein